MVQEPLVHRIISGDYVNDEQLSQIASQLNIPQNSSTRYQAILLKLDHDSQLQQQYGLWRISEMMKSIADLCMEIFKEVRCCREKNGGLAMICSSEGYIATEIIQDKSRFLAAQIKNSLGLGVTVGIGTRTNSLTGLTESLRNAGIAARYRLVYGLGQVITYESIVMRIGVSPQFSESECRGLIIAFQKGDAIEFEKRLAIYLATCYSHSAMYGRASVTHLLVELYRSMPPNEQLSCNFVSLYMSVHDAECMTDQYNYILDFTINMLKEKHEGMLNEKHKEKIETMLNYIRMNFCDPDLSIASVAEYADISTNTMRMLFREMGLPAPKDYLQSLRMDEACRLLNETNLTAKCISEMIGFTDSRYFYTVFKKTIGKTAFEYRTEQKNKHLK